MMTLTARQLYFEAVKVGDELPPLVKPPVDRLQIARYVGAAQDWNPLYLDEPHARNSGFPSALAPGMIGMGFLGELAVDWVRGARLRRFQARFVKIVWPGDVLTSRGRVVDRRFEEGGKYAIDIEAWAENQRGELVVRGLATFQLYYSADDEARHRAGQPPLVVTKEEEDARLAKLSRAQPPRPAAPVSRPLAPARPLASPSTARPLGSAAPASQVARAPQPPARPAAQSARPAAPPARAAPPASRPASPTPARPAAVALSPARPAAAPPPSRPVPAPAPAHPAAPASSRTAPTAVPARPPARPAARAAARPAAGKAKKAAHPRPAKRPVPKDKAARARTTRGPARKPSGKKRR
jgi:acyl dehydratase